MRRGDAPTRSDAPRDYQIHPKDGARPAQPLDRAARLHLPSTAGRRCVARKRRLMPRCRDEAHAMEYEFKNTITMMAVCALTASTPRVSGLSGIIVEGVRFSSPIQLTSRPSWQLPRHRTQPYLYMNVLHLGARISTNMLSVLPGYRIIYRTQPLPRQRDYRVVIIHNNEHLEKSPHQYLHPLCLGSPLFPKKFTSPFLSL